MPKGRPKCEGLKDLPNVPYYPGEMAPMMRDTDFDRGPLRDINRDPIARVMPFSNTATERGGGSSPADARFTAGRPNLTRSMDETRMMPETQLPGSYNAQAGNGAPIASANLRRFRPPLDGHDAKPNK